MAIFDNIMSKYDETGVPFGYRLMMLGQMMQQAGGGGGGGGISGNAMAAMMKEARERAQYNRTVQSAIEYAKKVDNPELMYMVQNGLISPTDLVERVQKSQDLNEQRSYDKEVLGEQRSYDEGKVAKERAQKVTDWNVGMAQGPSMNAVQPQADVVPERLRRLRSLTGIPDLTEEEGQTILAAGPELGPKAIENIQKQRASSSTEDTKELDRINEQRAAAGLPTLRLDEWLTQKGKANAQNINIGEGVEVDGIQFGKLEPGTALIKDATQPGGYRVIPLTGSKQAQEIADAQEKARQAAGIAGTRARTALETIGNIRRLQENSSMPVVGKITQIPMYGYLNPSAESVKNELDTLGGAIAMQNLGDIRATSPTGGALGSITEMENRMMMGYYGNIQQSTDEETFDTNLDRVSNQYRQFLRRNVKAAELYAEAQKTGDFRAFKDWVAKEEADLANQLFEKFGESSIDSLTDRDRIKGLIKTDPEDDPSGGVSPAGQEVAPPGPAGGPPPQEPPVQPPPGSTGALPEPATPPGPTSGAAPQVATPKTFMGLPVDQIETAYLVPKVNELPPGYKVDYTWGENQPKEYGVSDQPAMVLDPNGRMVGTVEPDGRIKRADFKAYSPDQLDVIEGVTGEREPGQRKRREILNEQSKMAWPEWLGNMANDTARVGAKGVTLGGLDWLLGKEDQNLTRESKIRMGLPGELAEITGNVVSPIARPISAVAKLSPAIKGAYEAAPGVLKWLMGGAEGAGVAGASSYFRGGDPKGSAMLGGIAGLGMGAFGPIISAIARGALGFPSRVGGKAIGEAYKQGATQPSTMAETLEKQTFKDLMTGKPPTKFDSQYKQDYDALDKKFIPGSQNVVSDAVKKKAAADLKARPVTTVQSDTEVKQMMKLLATPKGKGKNTIRDWDKVYRDLERFEHSADKQVAETARRLRDTIEKSLAKVDPKYKTMVENRKAGVRGGKAGAKFSGIDPHHVEQLLIGASLLNPGLLSVAGLTVPRVAGNIAYRAGQLSQNMPSWGGAGGILEHLMEGDE